MGPKRKLTAEQERAIVASYLVDKQTVQAISVALAIPRITVQRSLLRNGVAARPELAKPRVFYRRKLDAVEACLNGMLIEKAAAKYGMSAQTLGRALREHSISLPKGRPPRCTLNHAAFDEITPASAYWMGFLFADGAVGDDSYGAPWLATHLAERDRGHVEKFRDFLGSNHAITRTVTEQRFGGPAVYFKVRSRRLVEALESHGMGPVKSERAPSSDLVDSRDFWRGAVDGDGSFGYYGTKMFMFCGQARLVNAFISFAARREIQLSRRTKGSIFRTSATGVRAEKLVEILYAGCEESVALERKLLCAQRDILPRQHFGTREHAPPKR